MLQRNSVVFLFNNKKNTEFLCSIYFAFIGDTLSKIKECESIGQTLSKIK